MLRAVEGVGVLFLLSAFFAYVVAPMGAAVQRRIRFGRRQRPISLGAALIVVYLVLFVPAAFVWQTTQSHVSRWVHVTAPAAVDSLFSGRSGGLLDRLAGRLPISVNQQQLVARRGDHVVAYIEREVRSTLRELVDAVPYARWLLVAPVLAFVLLTNAPGFQRSTLRVLPHGHLQWRGEEYLRDVNSALAGYVRAQSAAGLIVGAICVVGFTLIGMPSAAALGIAAGLLELAPAIGPLAVLLIASAQAGDRLVAVVVFLGALRIVQDYVIYPRLIRKGMHLSTPAVILTLWAGAALAGAAGLVLAIPVAGFLSVSLRHWREFRDIERLVKKARRVE